MSGFAAAGLTMAHAWLAVMSHLSQMATGALVTAIWQGILFAAAAALGLRLLPKTPAAVRFAIWFAVFLVVMALPVVCLWPHSAGAAHADGKGAWLVVNERWCLAIAVVWAIASLVRAGTLVAAAMRVRSLWLRATPVESGRFIDPTHGDETAMNGVPGCYSRGQRKAQICVSEEVDRPTVIGFFAPKILIPGWLLERLTPAELEQIVVHEIGHLGRADDWLNLLQKTALVIFPLNPALAWVERRLCFERELAVDERVLRAFAGRPGAAKAYAACLATLAEYRLGRRALALALGALGRESELGRRVGRILRRGEAMRPMHAKLVLGGAMLGLLVGAAGLERCPQVVGFVQPATIDHGTGNREQATAREQGVEDQAKAMDPGIRRTAVVPVPIIDKARMPSYIRPTINVPHESLLVATQTAALPAKTENAGTEKAIELSQRSPLRGFRMVRTQARMPVASRQPRSISDVMPAQPAPVVQWMVVTTWDGNTVSRMVLTTARETAATANGLQSTNPIAGESGSGVKPGPNAVQPGPSYAAVPVRGGWLVFQLL